jgi:hypothetical protein
MAKLADQCGLCESPLVGSGNREQRLAFDPFQDNLLDVLSERCDYQLLMVLEGAYGTFFFGLAGVSLGITRSKSVALTQGLDRHFCLLIAKQK